MPRLNCSRISLKSRCSSSSCGSRRSIRMRVSRGVDSSKIIEPRSTKLPPAAVRAAPPPWAAVAARRWARLRRAVAAPALGARPAAPEPTSSLRPHGRGQRRDGGRGAAVGRVVLVDPAVDRQRLLGRPRPAQGVAQLQVRVQQRGALTGPERELHPLLVVQRSRRAPARPVGRRSRDAPAQFSARSYPWSDSRSSSAARARSPIRSRRSASSRCRSGFSGSSTMRSSSSSTSLDVAGVAAGLDAAAARPWAQPPSRPPRNRGRDRYRARRRSRIRHRSPRAPGRGRPARRGDRLARRRRRRPRPRSPARVQATGPISSLRGRPRPPARGRLRERWSRHPRGRASALTGSVASARARRAAALRRRARRSPAGRLRRASPPAERPPARSNPVSRKTRSPRLDGRSAGRGGHRRRRCPLRLTRSRTPGGAALRRGPRARRRASRAAPAPLRSREEARSSSTSIRRISWLPEN